MYQRMLGQSAFGFKLRVQWHFERSTRQLA